MSFSQDKEFTDSYFDLNYFRGNIALHNNDILHLIQGHPEGFILSWNKKTFGNEAWEQRYNYPDYGASIIYQDLKNESLGNNFGVYAHYNFYFFKRNLVVRIAQGLEELIYYYSVAFPEFDVKGDEDWKRVGVFIGHELFINKMSVETQLGYYVYYPYHFEGRVYNRIGLKRYFGDKVFGAITLKSHGAKAEAVEFGIGVRL